MTNIDVSQALYAVDAAISQYQMQKDVSVPRTLDADEWPPDYGQVFAWRQKQLALFENEPDMLDSARAWYAGHDLTAADGPDAYAERCAAFINHWCDTYDPRLAGTERPPIMPLVMFRRQEELVRFVMACMFGDASGLVEKSRDVGATWVCGAMSVWAWNFWPGFVAGWGSYRSDKVDVLGDAKSIFEKLRMLITGMPDAFRPDVQHGVELKQYTCRHPDNGSIINGEIGDNVGRGGRSRIYFVDEAAHLAHPEVVEASLSQNTRCRVDISSVSGPNTVFYRKRQAGEEWSPGDPVRRDVANVFVMDWSDHPEKSREWYADQRAYYAAQGTPEVVAREIDRDYMGAAEGIIIPYEYVEACVDAHAKLGFDDSGGWWGGLDLADEGPDKNALIRGRGVVAKYADEINERDPGAVARRAFTACRETTPIVLQYDSGGGFGGSVKSEFNRLGQDEGVDVSWLTLVPWSAAAAVQDPATPIIRGDKSAPTNKNFFYNFKAQAWWNVGRMFYRTWQAVHGHAEYPPEQMISLDSSTIPQATLVNLMRELSQATMSQSTTTLKLVVDKAPDGAKSPNLADALVMGRFPRRQLAGRKTIVGPKVFTA